MQQSARLELEPSATSVGEARRFVRDVLGSWGLEHLIDAVALLTSEVATNAVLHARTPYAIVLACQGREVVVDVLDGSPVAPQQRRREVTAATGRGVTLVDQLSSSWGPTPGGELAGFAKGVRFSVPLTGVGDSAWAGAWLS